MSNYVLGAHGKCPPRSPNILSFPGGRGHITFPNIVWCNERSYNFQAYQTAPRETTVAILSVNFIVLNTLSACTLMLNVIIYLDESSNLPDMIIYPIIINATVLIPLNSAINPVIYFTRNKMIREWLCGLCGNPVRSWVASEKCLIDAHKLKTYIT